MGIKRELAKDPELAEENWERFLPKFAKKTVARKKPVKIREKKTYTPFPPQQAPSKVDEQLESGEYFLSEGQRRNRRKEEKKAKASQTAKDRKREKEEQL